MKNCDEMVNSLLERRERYAAVQKRKRLLVTRTVTAACCVCLVAFIGFGMCQGGIFNTTPPINKNDSIIIGNKGHIDPNKSNVNTDVWYYPNNYSPDRSEKTIISSFDVNGTSSAIYATPENGDFSFSTPLRDAINEYGDSVLYRVVVDVFSGQEQLSSNSNQVQDECVRLSNNGYVVAYETFFDGESYHYYFTLHATYEELTSFNANENYGYFMFLYNERVKATAESPEVFRVIQ